MTGYNRPAVSKTTVIYKGRVVLNVDEEDARTSPKYIHEKKWEEKLKELYFKG